MEPMEPEWVIWNQYVYRGDSREMSRQRKQWLQVPVYLRRGFRDSLSIHSCFRDGLVGDKSWSWKAGLQKICGSHWEEEKGTIRSWKDMVWIVFEINCPGYLFGGRQQRDKTRSRGKSSEGVMTYPGQDVRSSVWVGSSVGRDWGMSKYCEAWTNGALWWLERESGRRKEWAELRMAPGIWAEMDDVE